MSSKYNPILYIFLILSMACSHLKSTIPAADMIYDGDTNGPVELATIINNLTPGTVIIIGEIHNLNSHHQKQLSFMEALDAPFHVALEFLNYLDQEKIDDYLQSKITEEKFVEAVSFGPQFPAYKPKILFSQKSGGRTLGINAPRTLSRQVSRVGIEGLSADEKKILPPQFTLGRDLYLQRFQETMGQHGGHSLPAAAIERYFAAQSLWDDTMAWQIARQLKKAPNENIVVIVGDFHASYGGGLEDRLRARGVQSIVAISQVQFYQKTWQERLELLRPHPLYGRRAHYIWASYEPTEQ